MTDDKVLIDQLIAAGRLAGERGLLWGTGGNMSLRINDNQFLITGRGTTLDNLAGGDLVCCEVHGSVESTPREASSEIQVHRRIYQRRQDIRSVIHLSSQYATLVACTDLELPMDLIPESILYLGTVRRVPYIIPATDALGVAVAEALGGGTTVLMGNHGAVTVGESLPVALRRMESLEFLSRMVVTARAAGLSLTGVGPEAAGALRRSIYGS